MSILHPRTFLSVLQVPKPEVPSGSLDMISGLAGPYLLKSKSLIPGKAHIKSYGFHGIGFKVYGHLNKSV